MEIARDLEILPLDGGDLDRVMRLASAVLGAERAGPLIRSHVELHHVLIARLDGDIVGFLTYRTDWFQCTMVSAVGVREDVRRRGVARALYRQVEDISPSPRLFSTVQETNAAAIRMHRELGFVPSGHIDNLPQGYRELLFYKRVPPSSDATRRR